MKSIYLGVILLLCILQAQAENREIIFSYWSEAGPPIVFLKGEDSQKVTGGLVKDLAVLISTRLNASPRFLQIPVQRTESQLLSGAIDLNCITNPIWKKQPDDYFWSPVLFKGADRFLVSNQTKHVITDFADLKGKALAVYKGYTYHPTIMKMIQDGDINAVKVSGIDQGVQLLLLGRIDALIDFDIALEYKIKNEFPGALRMAEFHAETYDLHCAYSKKTNIDRTQLDKVFRELISQGEIQRMLARYK